MIIKVNSIYIPNVISVVVEGKDKRQYSNSNDNKRNSIYIPNVISFVVEGKENVNIAIVMILKEIASISLMSSQW